MPRRHGFCCKRHFLFPSRSANGWKGVAERAVWRGPHSRETGTRKNCAPWRVAGSGAVQTSDRAPHMSRRRTGGRPLLARKWRHGRGTTRRHLPFGGRRGGNARHGGRAADPHRTDTGPGHRTPRTETAHAGAGRRHHTFTRNRLRRGVAGSGGIRSGRRRRCHRQRQPIARRPANAVFAGAQLAPTGTSMVDPTA